MCGTLKHRELVKLLDLKNFALPKRPRVNRIEFYEAPDWSGDPSIYIYILLADNTRFGELTFKKLRPLEDAMHEAIRNAEDERFAYIRVWTEKEFRKQFPWMISDPTAHTKTRSS